MSEEHPARDGASAPEAAPQPSREPQGATPSVPADAAASTPAVAGDRPRDSGTTESGYSYTVVDEEKPAPAPRPKKEKRPREPVRVGPVVLAAIVVLPAIAAAVAAWFVASALADDGDGDARTNANVASVLNAFSQGEPGSTRRIEGALPPGLPEEIPSYPGSRVVSSLINVSDEDVVYVVISDTGDSLEETGAFFAERLNEDPWQLEGAQDGAETSLRQFTKVDDADIEGVYLLAESKDGDVTTIFLSVQVTSGADETELDEFEPRVSKTLPDGFPEDVPSYPDGTVIETGFQRQPQGTRYSVSLITRDTNASVLNFFRDAFEEQGWTVQDTDASQAGLENAEAITFEADGGDVTGNVIAGEFAEDANYTRVDVNVFQQ